MKGGFFCGSSHAESSGLTGGLTMRAETADSRTQPAVQVPIHVKGVSKSFMQNGAPLAVLDDVDFYASDGEFVCIIGPSGCGKSTLLNIIAGLDRPSKGVISLHGRTLDSRLGEVGYMQQRDLLMPWRSVLDNAVIGLELKGVSKNEAHARARALLQDFGLAGFENEYPHALSGGMRQRAAFLRTVLADQEVFLLDEPFGALDALTRSQIQEWLLGMWRRVQKTIVMVTHDVDEAIFLSDRVYVMSSRPGRMKLVQEVDLPRPRLLEMVTQPRFVELKALLLASVRGEVTDG